VRHPHPTGPKNLGLCFDGFVYGVYRPENDFELIPTVEMETRHPVEASFGSEFPSIYNQCGVMDA